MVGMTTTRRSGPLTRDDLERLRSTEDGLRYELIDGSIVVTPAPGRWHQTAVLRLAMILDQARPASMVVMLAPFDVHLADDTAVQPDVLVARRDELTDTDLPAAPVLAVEVLSPSTRHIDLRLKQERYLRAGCPSYWVVDPLQPSLTAWELAGGVYQEVVSIRGDEARHLTVPFAVDVVPADLVSD